MGTLEEKQRRVQPPDRGSGHDRYAKVHYNESIGQSQGAILGNLAQQFIQKLPQINKMKLVQLLMSMVDALQQKEIQLYFTDSSVEQHFTDYG